MGQRPRLCLCDATDSASGLKSLWSQSVIMSSVSLSGPSQHRPAIRADTHCHHCYQDIKEYRGTLFMTLYHGHDAGKALESDCCDCYKGGREWVWTLSDLSYLRALPGPSTHRHQPTLKTLKTQHHQGRILSFLANFPGRLVTRVYSEAVKFYLTLVNISDP